MSTLRKKPAKNNKKTKEASVRIRFESHQQVEFVKRAAARRGMGFNSFVRIAAYAIAERVMKAPPEEILGQAADGVVRETIAM